MGGKSKLTERANQALRAALNLANQMSSLSQSMNEPEKTEDRQQQADLLKRVDEIKLEDSPEVDYDALLRDLKVSIRGSNAEDLGVAAQFQNEDEQAKQMKTPDSPEAVEQLADQLEETGEQLEKQAEAPEAAAEAAPAPKTEEKQAQAMRNTLVYIAGLPASMTVKTMAGGINEAKLGKHKGFNELFAALDHYGAVMQTPVDTVMTEERAGRDNYTGKVRYRSHDMEWIFGVDILNSPVRALRDVILCAEKAIGGVSSFSLKHSSNMKKLVPAVSALLMQSYALLPKVSNLDKALVPYTLKHGRDTVRWDHVLADSVSQSYGDQLSMWGETGEAGGNKMPSGALTRKEALGLLRGDAKYTKAGKNSDKLSQIAQKSQQAQKENLAALTLPCFPYGAVPPGLDAENQQKQAGKLADRYIRYLHQMQRGLDDLAEMEAERNARGKVNLSKSNFFQLSKLINQVLADRDQIVAGLMAGAIPQQDTPLATLTQLGGMPLQSAAETIYEADKRNAAKLDTSDPSKFSVGGGNASVSILDFGNGRVLRSPKGNDSVLSANSGMHDEAVGKIGQFLGFNVVATAEAKSFVDHEGNLRDKGSIMALAKGKTARGFQFINSPDQERSANNVTFSVKEYWDPQRVKTTRMQGRVMGDIMKMDVVDYICSHRDRHTGNFMLNLEAKEGESTITAIDNDMVFGFASAGIEGFDQAVGALAKMHDRSIETFAVRAKQAFCMMTPEVKQALEKLDVEALGAMLEPYINRVARYGVMQRAKELKKIASSVPTADLTTREGIDAYLHLHYKTTMEEYFKNNKMADESNVDATLRQYGGSTLLKGVLTAFSSNAVDADLGLSTSMHTMLFTARVMNLPKEEIIGIIRENAYAVKDGKDVNVGEAVLSQPKVQEILSNFELPFGEFFAKYGKKQDVSEEKFKVEEKKKGITSYGLESLYGENEE